MTWYLCLYDDISSLVASLTMNSHEKNNQQRPFVRYRVPGTISFLCGKSEGLPLHDMMTAANTTYLRR